MFSDVKNSIILGLVLALAAFSIFHFSQVAVLKLKISNRDNTIQEQDTKITKLGTALETATEANKKLTSSLETQNKAVKTWEEDAKIRKDEAAKALAKAQQERDSWKTKFGHLLTDPPSNPLNQCASLEERLNQYLETRGSK